jgi:hypothetical protein
MDAALAVRKIDYFIYGRRVEKRRLPNSAQFYS